jgi:hypothetical protein
VTVFLTTDELQALADEEAFLARELADLEDTVAARHGQRLPLDLLARLDRVRTDHRLAVRARMLLAERAGKNGR